MKLEPDLLRALFLYVEEHAKRPISSLEDIQLHGWAADAVAYHVILAEEAGLLKAIIEDIPDTEDAERFHVVYNVQRLTSRGHEFLGTVRDPKHWRIVKDGAKKAGIATISSLFGIAEAYAKIKVTEFLGLPPS
ncbi:DUF2513 domain-containing protein [Mesorhizobium sp. ASY16-5R]|uniref:DUF2513 domain-containing protein n=1 Tax=Mesorhizobium sp. ASY16-5R TaxID=3445772 RepID=UPI003FA0365A